MFDNLSDKLQRVFKNLRGEGKLTAENMESALREIRMALIEILGSHESKLRFANEPPSVFLIVGLQGSGKTTSTGKLARWLGKNGHRPMVVSVDVYRPAAREQLKVIAREINQPIYEGAGETKPLELARGARKEATNTGRDVVLVDTAGRLHIDDQLMVELQELKSQLNPVEILFVADA